MDILEPNMYVRTKEGFIAKIQSINEALGGIACDSSVKTMYEEHYNYLWGGEVELVVKASHNIIDLIQVGDYVNGSKVVDISIIGKDKEKWVWVEQMEDTDNKYGDDYVGYNNEQIKSIVTKEMFESMSYKVQD